MDSSIRRLPGIGVRREKLFARLGVTTIPALLQYFPRDYEDRSHVVPIGRADLERKEPVLVCGRVGTIQEIRPRRGMTILKVVLHDETGAVEMTWFNQSFKKKQFHTGMTVSAFGRIEWNYGRRQMNTPDVEDGEPQGQGFMPLYGLTDGLRQSDVRKAVRQALTLARTEQDLLPAPCRPTSHSRFPLVEAYEMMHFPKSREEQEKAREQLAYEELFDMQAGLCLRRRREGRRQGIKCGPNGPLLKQFFDQLPFALTRGQTCAFLDIQNDMEGEVPMQRLVQGDVGSGKTVVAALALAKIVENGYQGALMAPTEILASQHYEEFSRLFQGLPVRIALLTGRTGARDRVQLLEDLQSGAVQILIGTHALIQDDVQFAALGLVVTDEQHRFG
ncbi:DEAD/DEAH box helicase, partial [Megasphaera sp. UBA4352]